MLSKKITPPYLVPGDTIAIVATARKVSKNEIAPVKNLIESWGYKVKIAKELFSEDHQLAGNDVLRAAAFQKALDDKKIKAIVFARGGYGTVRIIDQIDWKKFIKSPKWLVGFSDITVIHSHLNKLQIAESIHAPMCLQLLKTPESIIHVFKQTLAGKPLNYAYETKPAALSQFNIKGKGEGELVGGNLSIIYSLLGSASDLDTSGKILFLEDLDEYRYHIDRMMQALKRAGKFEHLKGLIIGGMTDMRDNEIPFGQDAETIIHNIVKNYHFPVAFGFPAGHLPHNYPLLLGRRAKLHVGQKITLHFEVK
ncbi:MAG: hypothetical protein RIQ89_1054 [Bacteroidota bacterium]|jgi:muramoyltetrapeptide carboxypeptidase